MSGGLCTISKTMKESIKPNHVNFIQFRNEKRTGWGDTKQWKVQYLKMRSSTQAKWRSYKMSCKEKLRDHSRRVWCSCKPDSWGCSNQTLETASEEAAQCSWPGKDEVHLLGTPQQPLVQQNSRPETQLSETHRIISFAKNTYFKNLTPKNAEIVFSMQINTFLLAPSL